MRFALQIGFTVRRGTRTLTLVRELENNEYVLEDVITGRPQPYPRHILLQEIYSGHLQVVVATNSSGTSGAEETQVVDFDSLRPRDRARLEYRLAYVNGLEKMHIGRGQRELTQNAIPKIAEKIGHKKVPSATTVMLWRRLYDTSDRNPVSLLDRHSSRHTPSRLDDRLLAMVGDALKRHYLTPAHRTLKYVKEQLDREIKAAQRSGQLGKEAGEVSYPTLTRIANEIDLYTRIAKREGIARARMVCRTAFPNGVVEYPYQRAEIDHTPLNWVVICDRTGLPLGRPVLTIVIDSYSGYVLGFYISFYGPGVHSVAGALRSAILPKEALVSGQGLTHPWLACGVMDEAAVDNGLEFHSFSFKSMAMALGMDIMYCKVRTPWLKPHVERFFGSLNFLGLVRGRIEKSMANVLRIDPYKDQCITFSNLVKGLLMYIVDVHPHQVNMRKLQAPFELFREGIQMAPPASFPGNLDQLRLATGMSKRLTLGPGGIEMMGLPYGSTDFLSIMKKHGKVKLLCKWDPDDISILYVQDPDTRAWYEAFCKWKSYAKGLSFNQHRLIQSFRREQLKCNGTEEALHKARIRLYDHWNNAEAAAGRRAADAQLAGRFADVTSSKVLANDTDEPASPDPASKIFIPSQSEVRDDAQIPDFASFEMH